MIAFRRIGAALFGLTLVGSWASGQPSDAPSQTEPEHMSLVRLLANPDEMNQKIVSVTGFATAGYENNFLFLSQADAEAFIPHNAVRLELTPAQEAMIGKGRLVVVDGTFSVLTSRAAPASGRIRNIIRIYPHRVTDAGNERQSLVLGLLAALVAALLAVLWFGVVLGRRRERRGG